MQSENQDQIRAWQGHLKESKAFVPIGGKIKIVLIPIIDIDSRKFGESKEFFLDASQPQILIISGGYLNGIQFKSQDAELMVFSNFSLEESKNDDVRFEKANFYAW